jgi:DNA-binding beta-propeller fold protein YncE/Tol biopolymer transport system component
MTGRLVAFACVLCAAAGVFTVISAPALAVETHPLVKTFGGAASISGANGIAIAPTSGDLYVSDPGNDVVEKLVPATGALVSSFGDTTPSADGRLAGTESKEGSFAGTQAVASDASSGDLYVVDSGHGLVLKFDQAGKLLKGFGEEGQIGVAAVPLGTPGSSDTGNPFQPWAVAVDPVSGDVYVADISNSTVDKFDANGKFISQIDVSGTVPGPSGVAVDASGNVYVAGSGSVEEYDSAGADQGPLDQSGSDQGVGVEEASGDVYLAQGSRIAQFSAGSNVGSFGQAGAPRLSNGNAVAVGGGEAIFVADNGAPESELAIFEFGPAETTTAPEATIDAPSAVTTGSAHLAGTVDPNGRDTTWHFEISTDKANWSPVGSDQDAGSGSSPVEVSADATGLQPSIQYFVRLVANNQLDPVLDSEEQTFTTPGEPPSVNDKAPIFNLTETAVTIRANVTPFNGVLTTCSFEYGTSTSYGSTIPCSQDAVNGPDAITVSADLTGLAPGTTYHFRLDAANATGAAQGPDAEFTTPKPQSAACPNAALRAGPSANLPDCRAYEQVSPVQKDGTDVFARGTRVKVAADGHAVIFPSLGGFGDVHGTGVSTDYIADRGSDGWAAHNVYPKTPQLGVNLITILMPEVYADATEDLSSGIFTTPFPLTDDPATAEIGNIYRRADLEVPGLGSYTLFSGCPHCEEPGGTALPAPASSGTAAYAHDYFVGASSDLSHVLFESRQDLTDDAPGACGPSSFFGGSEECPMKLYESVDGVVRLASILPGGAPAPVAVAGAGSASAGELPVWNAISQDGSRVIFTDSEWQLSSETALGYGAIGNVYMRVDGTSTVQLNASERTDCADHDPCTGAAEPDPSGPTPAKYLDASADGTRIAITTNEALTDDAPVRGAPKLYLYDANAAAGHHLTLVAPAPSEDPNGALEDVVDLSPDGHSLYFIWSGLLHPGEANGQAVSPPNGNRYLYRWHDGVTTLVGAISQTLLLKPSRGTEVPETRVSPDGSHILFLSQDETGPTGYRQNGNGELYLYSATDNSLSCVSCNPSGAPATSGAKLNVADPSNIPTPRAAYKSHALSDDGRFVFFSTAEALVPQDVNGVSDAYEYDAETGQLHLLSTGSDPSPSYFMDATPDGSDAIIVTRQQLVGQDGDQLNDVYDARIDGGIAAQSPATAPPACADSVGCHGVPPNPPGGPTPNSLVFAGPGNATAGPSGAVQRLVVTGRGGKGALKVTIKTPGRGRLLIRGAGLLSRSRNVALAGSYTIKLTLSRQARKALQRRRKATILVTVNFTSATGAKLASHVTVTVKA